MRLFLNRLCQREWWSHFLQECQNYCLPALATLVIFQLRLHFIPEEYYSNRDDGVITLSSAKNIVDFGFLGVSPSGERVEAFSAPLQAVLFGLTYMVTGVGYQTFILMQTLMASFCLGLAIIFFFRTLDFDPTSSAGGTVLAAVLATFSGTFMVWHHSGMENCITHLGVVLLVALALRLYKTYTCSFWIALPLVAIAFCRIEFIYECSIVILLASCFSSYRVGRVRPLLVAALFFGGWGVLFAARYSLSGTWLPNTAAAQHISIADNLRSLFSGNRFRDQLPLFYQMLTSNLGVLLLGVGVALPIIHWRGARAFCFLLLSTVILAALARAFLLGPSRLDPVRTVTFLTPVVALLVSLSVLSLRGWAAIKYLIVGVLFIPPVSTTYAAPDKFVCCSAAEFEGYRCLLSEVAVREQIPRALVANPDLGAISFAKTFNVFDLGALANPVLIQLRDDESVATYFYSVVAPDVIEVTPWWRERTRRIFDSPLLASQYLRITEWSGACSKPGIEEFYVRRDVQESSLSRERAFIDELSANLTVSRIDGELSRCLATTPENCLYIVRSVYRFLPELRSSGKYKGVLSLFQKRTPDPQVLRWGRAHLSSDRSSEWISVAQEVVDELSARRNS